MNDSANNKPSVRIVSVSSAGADICAAASRISTTSGDALSIYEKSIDNPNNEKLVGNVLSSGHKSVMEHCFFNIAFSDVSVFVEQYMIEFRLSSFTVQSRRYVDFSNAGFYRSPSFTGDAATEYDDHMKSLFADYGRLLDLGIPKEDARCLLPYCFHSNFYCSCNARELMHMISTMIYGRGSLFGELFDIGNALAEEFEKYFPGELAKGERFYAAEKARTSAWLDSLKGKHAGKLETVTATVEMVSHSTVRKEDILSFERYDFAPSVGTDAAEPAELLRGSRQRTLELISFSFAINDISLSSITHLVRHRMQSVMVPCVGSSVFSGRHILPSSIKENAEALAVYNTAFERNAKVFNRFVDNGMAPCECVYFALSGCTLSVLSSMNGREFAHFIKLRTCSRAQWEIRGIAEKMLLAAREIYPVPFDSLGPSCFVNGACPEGKKTCGRITEMKDKFYSHFLNLDI